MLRNFSVRSIRNRHPEYPSIASCVRVKRTAHGHHVPPRTPHVSPSSITPGHPALSLSPSFIQHLSLYPKPWRGSHLSPPLSTSTSPELHRRTPEIDAGELLHLGFIFLLGARRFPNLFLHLPQTPSKKSKLELHQVISSISELLLV